MRVVGWKSLTQYISQMLNGIQMWEKEAGGSSRLNCKTSLTTLAHCGFALSSLRGTPGPLACSAGVPEAVNCYISMPLLSGCLAPSRGELCRPSHPTPLGPPSQPSLPATMTCGSTFSVVSRRAFGHCGRTWKSKVHQWRERWSSVDCPCQMALCPSKTNSAVCSC